jgi:5-methylcytosine-specific restriction endonuclease McrA
MTHAPRICPCGNRVAAGIRCPCEAKRDAARKARFDRCRPNARARGYNRAWQAARAAFLAQHPRCTRCGEAADTVDHITPHRGDRGRFWDRANWQALCTRCHSGAKQSEERRNLMR